MTKRKREDNEYVKLEPYKIGYTQDTISKWINMKQDGVKTKVKLDDLVDLVLDGDIDINDIKNIEVFRMTTSFGMRWYSLDNRRLWLFKTLHELGYGDEDFTIKCKLVPFNQIHNKKLTTTNFGQTVQVRGSVKHRVKLVGKRRCHPANPPGSLENDGGISKIKEEEICHSSESEDPMPARKKVKAYRRLESPAKNGITVHINAPADNFSNVGLQVAVNSQCGESRARFNINGTNGKEVQTENCPPSNCSLLFGFGQAPNFWSRQNQMPNNRQPFRELSNYQGPSSCRNQWQPPYHPRCNFSANFYQMNRPTLCNNIHGGKWQRTNNFGNNQFSNNYGHNIRYNFATPTPHYQTPWQRFNLPPSQTAFDFPSSVNSMMKNLNTRSRSPHTEYHVDSFDDELFW